MALNDVAVTPDTLVAGRYRILGPLGAGGMGSVHRAEDQTLEGAQVALKFLYPHLVAHDDTFARFRNEVLVARKLLHPNIVRTYNIGWHGSQAFIAMEYVPGRTIQNLLRQEHSQGMPLELALEITGQLCCALEHSHALGIIHRDIKPDNVLFTPSGQAKITDFGLAATLRRESHFTRIGQILGTPYYMPPEQFLGQTTDERSDIYALGMLLYELICGTVAFRDTSLYRLAQKHLREPLPRHPRLELPEHAELWQILCRCTEKSRDRRYRSTEALLDDLCDRFGDKLTSAGARERSRPRSALLPAYDEEWIERNRRRRRKTALMSAVFGLVTSIVWTRNNISIQKVLGAPLLIAERFTGHRFDLIRSVWHISVHGPPMSMATEMNTRAQHVTSRLWAGEDPNDPRNIERHWPLYPGDKSWWMYATHLAADTNPTLLKNLLDYYADPNLRDSNGRTLLHHVVERADPELVQRVLNAGAVVNIVDRRGETPLFSAVRTAAKTHNNDMVELLLRYGGNPTITNRQGVDVLAYAVESSANDKLLKLLLRSMPRHGRDQYTRIVAATPQERQEEIRAILAEHEKDVSPAHGGPMTLESERVAQDGNDVPSPEAVNP